MSTECKTELAQCAHHRRTLLRFATHEDVEMPSCSLMTGHGVSLSLWPVRSKLNEKERIAITGYSKP